jgi:hypothetical protein
VALYGWVHFFGVYSYIGVFDVFRSASLGGELFPFLGFRCGWYLSTVW